MQRLDNLSTINKIFTIFLEIILRHTIPSSNEIKQSTFLLSLFKSLKKGTFIKNDVEKVNFVCPF